MDVIFFNPKVEEFLLSLDKDSSNKSYRHIKLLKTFGNQLRMPYSKQISNNLYELRVRGRQEVRLLYFFYQNQAMIIHIFIKKSQKTPQREITLALNRISLLTK